MASRQAIIVGFPSPNFVSETASRDAILPGTYLVETASLSPTITENAAAVDAPNATSTGNTVAVSEAAAAADAPSETYTGLDTVTEPASVTDAPNATSTGNTVAVSEAAHASDSSSDPVTPPAGITATFVARNTSATTLLVADATMSEYSYSTGMGTYALAGAWGGRLRLSSFYITGASVVYEATDRSANSEWGIGTYNAGTNTLNRGLIISSTSGGHPINWSGRTRIIITPLCECGTLKPQPPPPPPPAAPPPPPPGGMIIPEAASGITTYVSPSIPTRTLTLTTHNPNDIVILHVVMNAETGPAPSVTAVTSTSGLVWTKRTAVSGITEHSYYADVEIWWALAPSPLAGEVITIEVSSQLGFLTAAAFGAFGANLSAPWDTNGSLPAVGNNLTGAPAHPTVSGVSTDQATDLILFFFDEFSVTDPLGGPPGFTVLIQEGAVNAFIDLSIESISCTDVVSATLSSVTLTGHVLSPGADNPIPSWIVIADALRAA
jgi:hypothetical protein